MEDVPQLVGGVAGESIMSAAPFGFYESGRLRGNAA